MFQGCSGRRFHLRLLSWPPARRHFEKLGIYFVCFESGAFSNSFASDSQAQSGAVSHFILTVTFKLAKISTWT